MHGWSLGSKRICPLSLHKATDLCILVWGKSNQDALPCDPLNSVASAIETSIDLCVWNATVLRGILAVIDYEATQWPSAFLHLFSPCCVPLKFANPES